MDEEKNETKKEKFERLAALRTNEVLKRLRILGNCSNRNFYEYTDRDIQKIFSAIEDELKTIKAMFRKSQQKEFKL